MISFAQFLSKYTNPPYQKVDYDHIYAFQCVDLIRQYCYECAGLGDAAGGPAYAIGYWTHTPGGMLTKFNRVDTRDVAAGDIVVLNPRVGTDAANSHITLATGAQNAAQYEAVEQNGSTGNGSGNGGDAIRLRWIDKSRIAGVLRPINAGPPMITLEQLNSIYSLHLNRAPDVGAVAHYVGHYTYDFVSNDVQNSNEYRIIHTPAPAPAPAAPAPVEIPVPIPAPVPIPVLPAAPTPIPTSTEKYLIRTTLYTYASKTEAQNRKNPRGEIQSGGQWFIYCEKDGMYNITQQPGITTGTWINPADNVKPVVIVPPAPVQVPVAVEPPPAPVEAPRHVETEQEIRHSFQSIMPDGSPIECEVLQNIMIVDVLGNGTPMSVRAGRELKVYGTFEALGRVYGLVKVANKANQANYMYGVPIAARDDLSPYLKDTWSMAEQLRHNWEQLFDKSVQTIDGFFKARRKKKQ